FLPLRHGASPSYGIADIVRTDKELQRREYQAQLRFSVPLDGPIERGQRVADIWQLVELFEVVGRLVLPVRPLAPGPRHVWPLGRLPQILQVDRKKHTSELQSR